MKKVLDKSRIDMLMELDVDGANEILSSFNESIDERYNLIIDAIETKNFNILELQSHSLKGSSANLGFDQLSDIAARLESFAKEGNHDQARVGIEELIKIIDESKAELVKILKY